MPAETPRTLIARASHLIDIGRPDEAIPLLLDALSAAPDSATALSHMAHAHYVSGRTEPALEAADRAAHLAPNDEWPHRLRAHCLRRKKRYSAAVEAARQAVRLAPQSPDGLYVLTLCLSDNRRYREAAAVAAKLLAAAPDRSLSHFACGLVEHRQNHWKAAEQHYRAALSINAEDWQSMNNFGLVLQRQRRTREAIDMFHNAARLRPAEEVTRKNLKSTVGAYAGGSCLVIWVGAQIMRALFEAAGPNPAPAAIAVVLLAGTGMVGGWLLWRRKRLAELNDTVKTFYHVEVRRERRETVRSIPRLLLVTLTILILVFWTLFALAEGADAMGLTSWPALLYVGFWVALAAEIIWIRKARREKQR